MKSESKTMTTALNGTEFMTLDTRTFRPTFEGAQARRPQKDYITGSLISRRNARRDRRATRAI